MLIIYNYGKVALILNRNDNFLAWVYVSRQNYCSISKTYQLQSR
jgi:formylmethanofuran dehydrogenase subunit E